MEPSITLKELTERLLAQAKEKGFGAAPEEIDVPEKIALIHSEVSDALEAYRHKKIQGRDSLEEELGDVVQRVLHLAGALNLNIEDSILEKLDYNRGKDWDWEKMNETHA